MSRMDSREQKKLKERLAAIAKQPGNRNCSECGLRSSQWCSTNLGIFFCLTCSGHHRNLGVHISKVKSTRLDTWKEKEVDFMESMGNTKANAVWEYNIGRGQKIDSNVGDRERGNFIKNKYERKQWYREERRKKKKKKAVVESSDDSSSSSESDEPVVVIKKKKKKKDKKKKKKKDKAKAAEPAPEATFGSFEDQGFEADFGNLQVSDPTPPPVPVAQPDLFGAFGSSEPAPQPQSQPQSNDGFGSFFGNDQQQAQQPQQAQQAQQQQSNGFDPFGQGSAAPAPAPAPEPVPDTTNSIMGLFNSPAPSQPMYNSGSGFNGHMQGMPNNNMNNMGNNMGMNNMGMNNMGMNNMGMNNMGMMNNNMGMTGMQQQQQRAMMQQRGMQQRGMGMQGMNRQMGMQGMNRQMGMQGMNRQMGMQQGMGQMGMMGMQQQQQQQQPKQSAFSGLTGMGNNSNNSNSNSGGNPFGSFF